MDVVSGATGGRGMREGDELVREIFELERSGQKKLVLVPLLFVWSKSPDKRETGLLDFVLGPRTWPTPTRALVQFAYNMNHASLRWADPIFVGEVLRENKELSDAVLVRRITYMVLRRIERERRAVVGPTEKPPERGRQEILRSPRLQATLNDLAADNPQALGEKIAEAGEILKELQAQPNADVVKGMGVALRWGFNRIYRGIEFNQEDVDRVREASRKGALILLPSHKSHIDYLVLSYFFNERNLPLPLIAAGDNLNFQPIGPIFRRCGAFFIRRSFRGDRLYASTVDAYIRRLIRDGYPIELFLEGGRSRTGKLLSPKLGLLNMIVDAAANVHGQKVNFVPVSIGYERVVEADTYEKELSGGEKKQEDASDLFNASEVLRHRYGRINLQFGQMMSLEDICDDLNIEREKLTRPAKRRAVVTRVGNRVMDEINRVTAVTPGALTAMSLLAKPGQGLTEKELCAKADRLLGFLKSQGARVTNTTIAPDGSLRSQSISEALQMFVDAQLVYEVADAHGNSPRFFATDKKRIQLDTSKNIIVHFFLERGLIAASLNRDAEGRFAVTPVEIVQERVKRASRLFKLEFRFQAHAPFEEIFAKTCEIMIFDGHLGREGSNLLPGSGNAGYDGQEWLSTYLTQIAPFFAAYGLAARNLMSLLSQSKTEKELGKSAIILGKELCDSGVLDRRESVSKPVLANALSVFHELGYVRTLAGKVTLKDTFQEPAAVEEIVSSIEGYLTGQQEPLVP